MTIEKAQDSAAPTGAASVLSAGLGLMGRLRDWSDWSKSQAEDELSSLLGSAADEIERLRAALEDATEDRRTQYMTPEDSAAGDNEARCDCQATTATPKFVGKPKCEKCGCPGVLNTANADGGKSSEWRCWGWPCRHKWKTPNVQIEAPSRPLAKVASNAGLGLVPGKEAK